LTAGVVGLKHPPSITIERWSSTLVPGVTWMT
jgi:hypothetical protein